MPDGFMPGYVKGVPVDYCPIATLIDGSICARLKDTGTASYYLASLRSCQDYGRRKNQAEAKAQYDGFLDALHGVALL